MKGLLIPVGSNDLLDCAFCEMHALIISVHIKRIMLQIINLLFNKSFDQVNIILSYQGHSTIVLTLDTYSHLLPTMQQQATARLEKLLYSNSKKKVAA
jgi:hypothetical protein